MALRKLSTNFFDLVHQESICTSFIDFEITKIDNNLCTFIDFEITKIGRVGGSNENDSHLV